MNYLQRMDEALQRMDKTVLLRALDGQTIAICPLPFLLDCPFFPKLLQDSPVDPALGKAVVPIELSFPSLSAFVFLFSLSGSAENVDEQLILPEFVKFLCKPELRLDDAKARLRRYLLTSEVIRDKPLKVYEVACWQHWSDVAGVAARQALSHDSPGSIYTFSTEMVGPQAVVDIFLFRQKAEIAAGKALIPALGPGGAWSTWRVSLESFPNAEETGLQPESTGRACALCSNISPLSIEMECGGNTVTFLGHAWVARFIAFAASKVQERPGMGVMSGEFMDKATDLASSSGCPSQRRQNVRHLLKVLNTHVLQAVDAVTFHNH